MLHNHNQDEARQDCAEPAFSPSPRQILHNDLKTIAEFLNVALYDAALEFAVKSSQLARKEFGKNSSEYMNCLEYCALSYEGLGRPDLALKLYKLAAASSETVASTAAARSSLWLRAANIALHEELYADAERFFVRALHCLEEASLTQSCIYEDILHKLGELSHDAGRYYDSEGYLLRRLALDSTSNRAAHTLFYLANTYLAVSKPEAALLAINSSMHILRNAKGQDYDPAFLAEALWLEMSVYQRLKRYDDALQSGTEAAEILEEVYGANDCRVLLCDCSLASLSIDRNDLTDAAEALPENLAILRSRLGENAAELIDPVSMNARLNCVLANKLFLMTDQSRQPSARYDTGMVRDY